MYRRIHGAALACAGALLGAVAFAVPAQAADNGSGSWSNNSYTGYCDEVDGGYVLAAQTFLKTWGTYSGALDNYWGNGSNSALLSYQASRGLSADGCAGPSTWSNMQALIVNFHDGAVCGTAQGQYYRYSRSTRQSNFLRPDGGARYWRAQATPSGGGPVTAFVYYRFSDTLKPYCL